MQKQVKAGHAKVKQQKFRKALPMGKKSKGIAEAVTKSINKKIEREMSARAGKFNEPLTHMKVSKQAIAKTGWIKPGKVKGNRA